MIELGLARISRLLRPSTISWRAIHVAGTNGKGSVCSYASAMLHASNVKCGRFTSPHLIDRWDGITINDQVVDKSVYQHFEDVVRSRNRHENVQASEFELLTATAFEVFSSEEIEIAVVEVGLGGRHDATNILQNPLVTVITKIGMDHQYFLGHSLQEIAYQKAGIMKNSVPCITDGSNASEVIEVLEENAKIVKAAYLLLVPPGIGSGSQELQRLFKGHHFPSHQQMNVTLAYEAVKIAIAHLRPSLDLQSFMSLLPGVSLPGRLQTLDVSPVTGHSRQVLLDGAHNALSAQVLGSYVDRCLRRHGHPVTWVIASSQGKDVRAVLSYLLKPEDKILAEEFGLVEGMPWVHPVRGQEILDAAQAVGCQGTVVNASKSLKETVQLAAALAADGPLVVAGSLYLVSDFLRMVKKAEHP